MGEGLDLAAIETRLNAAYAEIDELTGDAAVNVTALFEDQRSLLDALRTSRADLAAARKRLMVCEAEHWDRAYATESMRERDAMREALERVKRLVEQWRAWSVSGIPRTAGDDLELCADELETALADPTPPVCPTCGHIRMGKSWSCVVVRGNGTLCGCMNFWHSSEPSPNTEQER